LYVGKDDSYSSFDGKKTGATIFIYDNDRFYTEADKIRISEGSTVEITIKKKLTEMAVKPYSQCIIKNNVKVAVNASTDTELVDLFIKSEYKYNYANCYDVCYQVLLNQTCGCIDYYIPFLNLKNIVNATLCPNYDCYFEKNFIGKLFDYCSKKCPYECDMVSISRSMLSESNPDYKNFVGISIYYPELSYEYTTESPTITGIALAGTIGGTLGKQIVV